jgi:O-antigen/teichoic acid export membrane protein
MGLDIKNNKNLITFLTANFIQLFFGLLIVIQMNIFSPKYLGIFIFQYTFFLVIGHLLTFGQHIFILNKLSQIKRNIEKTKYIENNFFSSIFPPLIGFLLLIFIMRFIENAYLEKLGSNQVILILSCLFFCFNKTLFNIQNGFNYFYNLSFLIIFRAIFLLSSITFILIKEIDLLNNLCFAFLFSEALLTLIYLIIYLIKKNAMKIKFHICYTNIKNSLKLFGDFFFSDLLLKIDILIIVYFFSFEKVSIYALTMVMIEGIITILVVLRNFFTSKFGYLIKNNNYKKYFIIKKKYGIIFFFITIFLTGSGYITLIILDNFLFNIEKETFHFYLMIVPSLLIYSYYINSEYIFSLKNNFFSQTIYFIKAIIFQIIILIVLFKSFSIYTFPIAINLMFLFMSVNLIIECRKNK